MFKQAPFPENEERRRRAVERTGLTETADEKLYEVYCHLSRQLTGCPQSWANVVHADSNHNFIVNAEGITETEKEDVRFIERSNSFCQYALLSPDPLIVSNMRQSPIFRDHPAVVREDEPILFYAAFPLVNAEGYILGSLCVRDFRVRRLSGDVIGLMRNLAAKLSHQLDMETANRAVSADKLLEILARLKDAVSDAGMDDAMALLKAFAGHRIATGDAERLHARGYADHDGCLNATGRALMVKSGLEASVLHRLEQPAADAEGLARLFAEID